MHITETPSSGDMLLAGCGAGVLTAGDRCPAYPLSAWKLPAFAGLRRLTNYALSFVIQPATSHLATRAAPR